MVRRASDATLVRKARNGSREAAGELFGRYWPGAWRAALVLTGRREMADDVAQDAFERAFAALSRFDESRPFGAWLHRIVVNRALDLMRPEEAETYAAARSVLDWHSRHQFCANCGTQTTMFRGGWGRLCPNCGAEHFPRTDPVVIMIAEHAGRALVGRGPQWPAGRYSALAGFMEPGESIEEAVAREIFEEAGVRVRNVRYIASQPWPFPSSLMMACIGEAEDDVITIDPHELQDAMWVSREDVRKSLAGDPSAPFLSPPHYAIAHTLLTAWVEEG